jgi:hypothetical protein
LLLATLPLQDNIGPAPSTEELKRLVQRIAVRIGRSLERSGLITRDIENAYLAFDPSEEAPIHGLLGNSITYRIATGPREGQKVFTLQTLPAEPEQTRREVAESSGFSLHAGIAAKSSQPDKLEHLARYVSRPPVATERLSLTQGGHVRQGMIGLHLHGPAPRQPVRLGQRVGEPVEPVCAQHRPGRQQHSAHDHEYLVLFRHFRPPAPHPNSF